jgi:hypothetical protein
MAIGRMKMKRSEMEEMIFTTLMQCHMADISTTAISKILLRAIEDVGMLPPPESSKLPRIKQLIDEASYSMVSLDRFKWKDEDD